jgi:CheY-like chemotaxis protein
MNAVVKPRVLCVDDEPNVLEGLCLSLRRPYEVVTAVGGVTGLEVLARERVD